MDQILIKDICARGIIGINPDERINKQDILINIVIFCDTSLAGESDKIEQSVNYRSVTKKVIQHAETAERLTVEALAADIAKIVLSMPFVEGVRVRVEKPGAVRFTRSVGVDIERHNST